MIIVLEGPDCAGKTTLAQALMKASGDKAKYIHLTRPDTDQWSFANNEIETAISWDTSGEDVIIDRLWVSDNVYSLIDPSKHRSGIHVRRQESLMHRYGAFNILCAPDPRLLIHEYKNKLKDRNEYYGDRFTDILKVMYRYRMLWVGRPTMIQSEEGQPEQYVDQLCFTQPFNRRPLTRLYDRFAVFDQEQWAEDTWEIAKIETRAYRRADPLRILTTNDYRNLSGSLMTARALLVGDVSGGEETRWPFYSCQGSSAYLTKALHRAMVPETDIALVNAYTREDTAPSKKKSRTRHGGSLGLVLEWVAEHRPRMKIVALGTRAAEALDDNGIENYVVIPHPQWARRFDHHGHYHSMLGVSIDDGTKQKRRASSYRPMGDTTDLSAADDLR